MEGPDAPDLSRSSSEGATPLGVNALFETLNRNKRAITLDLKRAEGRECSIAWSNKRTSCCKTLPRGKPRGWAQTTRLCEEPAPDLRQRQHVRRSWGGTLTVAAPPFRAGARQRHDVLDRRADPPPRRVRGPIADQTGSIMLTLGLLLALRQRDSGRGQEVNASLLEGIDFYAELAADRLHVHRQAQAHARLPSPFFAALEPVRGFGRPLVHGHGDADAALVAGGLPRDWPARPAGASPAAGVPPDRERIGDLIDQLDAVYATEPAAVWVERLRAEGMCADPIQDYADAAEDPQVIANEMVVDSRALRGWQATATRLRRASGRRQAQHADAPPRSSASTRKRCLLDTASPGSRLPRWRTEASSVRARRVQRTYRGDVQG